MRSLYCYWIRFQFFPSCLYDKGVWWVGRLGVHLSILSQLPPEDGRGGARRRPARGAERRLSILSQLPPWWTRWRGGGSGAASFNSFPVASEKTFFREPQPVPGVLSILSQLPPCRPRSWPFRLVCRLSILSQLPRPPGRWEHVSKENNTAFQFFPSCLRGLISWACL